jgi:carbon-monoxide dehydrogenase small subunit
MDGKAVKSCSVLAVQADGRNIVTVEGLADGEKLNPLQEAFHELHAVQCGYCTPGFLMCLTDLLQRKRTVEWTDEEIRLAISGNICRCTGYENIVKAAKRVLNGRSLSKPSQTNAAQLR